MVFLSKKFDSSDLIYYWPKFIQGHCFFIYIIQGFDNLLNIFLEIQLFFFFFFVFLGPHSGHMEVPRLGVKWEL